MEFETTAETSPNKHTAPLRTPEGRLIGFARHAPETKLQPVLHYIAKCNILSFTNSFIMDKTNNRCLCLFSFDASLRHSFQQAARGIGIIGIGIILGSADWNRSIQSLKVDVMFNEKQKPAIPDQASKPQSHWPNVSSWRPGGHWRRDSMTWMTGIKPATVIKMACDSDDLDDN